MKTYSAEPFVDGLVFPEGPRWHSGALWLSDMHGGFVYRIDPDGTKTQIVEVPGRPSGLGFLPDGSLLYVSMRDRSLYRHAAERSPEPSELVACLAAFARGDLNDMVVDGAGRAYVGNFGYDFETEGVVDRPTCLLLVDPGGEVRVVAEELAFPNGMVILADGSTLVVAESMGQRLAVFDIDRDGSLSNRRCFAELGGRMPDGIADDAEGAIWVACFLSDEFIRVHEGGAISARVSVEGRRAVACALGGEDRQTLYLLTAETSPEELMQGKACGFVERVRVDVPGAGVP